MRMDVEVAANEAIRLHRERGIPLGEACRIAARAVAGVSGLGQTGDPGLLARAAELEPVRVIRQNVTPWLWVLSVTGFVMAILNTSRIDKMFKDWRRKRTA